MHKSDVKWLSLHSVLFMQFPVLKVGGYAEGRKTIFKKSVLCTVSNFLLAFYSGEMYNYIALEKHSNKLIPASHMYEVMHF